MPFDPSTLTITPDVVDVVLPESGYPDDLAREDTPEALKDAFGSTSRDFPDELWIEPKDRKERAEQNDKEGLWAIDYLDRFTNQSPTHECTCHSLRAVAEASRNRQRRISLGGPKKGERLAISAESASVWFSTLSIYSRANPGERGGANVRRVCEIAVEQGFLPDETQPREFNFKHTMKGTRGRGNNNQSSGGDYPGWRDGDFRNKPSSWVDDDWKKTSRHFKPLECVNPRNADELECLLLHGFGVGVGRSGHAVPYVFIKYEGNRKMYGYVDSYDVIRFDSRPAWSGSFSILIMTAPDDWDRPAGEDHKV